MPSNADVVAAQLEKVNKSLPDLFENSDTLSAWLRKQAKKERISGFNSLQLTGSAGMNSFRIPVKTTPGGDYRAVNIDGGDFGGGSAMKLSYMTIGFFATALVVYLTQLELDATASDTQSVLNVLKKQLDSMLSEAHWYDDSGMFGDGTGVLAAANGTGAPSGTNPTYQLEPNFGPQRLRVGMPVGVWDTTLATYKNSGTVRVASFDVNAKTVTLSGTVTSPVNTDKITFDGLSASAPLSVGSYRNGIYTFQNTATSGSTLGLSRSTTPEIVTPSVNASGPLVPAHALLLQDTIIQRRDENAYRNLVGLLHQTQRAALMLNGIAISEWQRGSKDKMIDLVPENTKADSTVPLAGVLHRVAKKADRSRVDWINTKTYGFAELHPPKFHEVNGQRIFEDRSSTGTVKAAQYTIFKQADNLYNEDPGAGGVIYNLTLPTGY